MSYTYRILSSVEFKDRELTGPMVDQIVGTTRRIEGRFNGQVKDVYIYCRGANSGARSRAKEYEKELKIKIEFLVVKGDI